MTDERTLDRLMAHLRGHVAELRRLERTGAAPEDLAESKRLAIALQERLAYAVRELLTGPRTSGLWAGADTPHARPILDFSTNANP